MKTKFLKQTAVSIFAVSVLAASSASMAASKGFNKLNVQIGADNNSIENPVIQPQDPALSGGGRDQTLQFGDVIFGSRRDDLQIGGLGTDILAGGRGDDVIIGGIEHFNPLNRDRAFGGSGNDIFIWKPGDGSDLWNGGPGLDVVVFGLIGEAVNGNVEFKVLDDQKTAKVAINQRTYLPLVDVTNSPGFCEVIDRSTSHQAAKELRKLGLDHLVRFSLRGVRDAFEAGTQNDDNGLRVTLHLKSVELLVCTNRDGGQIEVVDLTSTPPRLIASGVSKQELKAFIRNHRLRNRLDAMIF